MRRKRNRRKNQNNSKIGKESIEKEDSNTPTFNFNIPSISSPNESEQKAQTTTINYSKFPSEVDRKIQQHENSIKSCHRENESRISNEKSINAFNTPKDRLPDEFKRNSKSESPKMAYSDVVRNVRPNDKVSKKGFVEDAVRSTDHDLINAAILPSEKSPGGCNGHLYTKLDEIDSYFEFYEIVCRHIQQYETLNKYPRTKSRWSHGKNVASASNSFNDYFPDDFKRILFSVSPISDYEFHSIIDRNISQHEAMGNDQVKSKKIFDKEVTQISNSLDDNLLKNFKKIFFSKSAKFEFCSDMVEQIQEYEESIKDFHGEYSRWSWRRECTLLNLKKLAQKVHDDQLNFNKANLLLKQGNMVSRMVKNSDNLFASFLATCGAFATDAIGGIGSAFQAMNCDGHMKTFGEIMENDIENTKDLYTERSKFFDAYKNVEEVRRCYHSDTFENTAKNIYQSLSANVPSSKKMSGGNELVQCIEGVDNFFKEAPVEQALDSFEKYIENNPATLDACESAGRALYGLYDTWSHAGIARATRTIVPTTLINMELNRRNFQEIDRLSSLVDGENMPQARLESKIHEAEEI